MIGVSISAARHSSVTALLFVCSCGGRVCHEWGGQGSAGSGASGGANVAGGAAGGGETPSSGGGDVYVPQNWRANLDYGGEPVPYIVNKAISGVGDDVFVAGYVAPSLPEIGFIDRLTETGWVPFYENSTGIRCLWAAEPSAVFAANIDTGEIALTDGVAARTWTIGDTKIDAMFGFSADDVVAVGEAGTVFVYDGTAWASEPSGTSAGLRGVWGSGSENVFAVGDAGTIVRRQAAGWTVMTSPTGLGLSGIWGSGPEDVYAVGGDVADAGHVIIHFDGSEWAVVNVGDDRLSSLGRVRGRSPSDLCAVGGWRRTASEESHPLFLHFDGTSWSEIEVDARGGLTDVWPLSTGAYLVSGAWDTLGVVEL